MEYSLNHIPKPWETPELTGLNRLPSRAVLYPFQSLPIAITCDRGKSRWYSPLSGEWKFKLYSSPEEVDRAVLDSGYDDESWRDITAWVSFLHSRPEYSCNMVNLPH